MAASCALCGGAAHLPHMNCANLDCNRLFLACSACKARLWLVLIVPHAGKDGVEWKQVTGKQHNPPCCDLVATKEDVCTLLLMESCVSACEPQRLMLCS